MATKEFIESTLKPDATMVNAAKVKAEAPKPKAKKKSKKKEQESAQDA